LLKRGARVDITDALGCTPLSAAASKGHLETVRELLNWGASVDIAEKDGRTPLIIAASEGHEEVLLELLSRGARVDITDAYGNTPLSAAASNMARGRDELIRALLLRSEEQIDHVSFKNIYCVDTSF
jgi:ankyrin repeat protein